MRLAPGRLEWTRWGMYPGWSLASSLDPGLMSLTPSASAGDADADADTLLAIAL